MAVGQVLVGTTIRASEVTVGDVLDLNSDPALDPKGTRWIDYYAVVVAVVPWREFGQEDTNPAVFVVTEGLDGPTATVKLPAAHELAKVESVRRAGVL